MRPILKGKGVSRGKANGSVRIVHDDFLQEDFEEGDILVTRLTDPTMVAMMNKASAIICEIGGLTSHPSIVSRELGIPCIVAATGATKILRDGEKIHVDGQTGEIRRISEDRWSLRWQK